MGSVDRFRIQYGSDIICSLLACIAFSIRGFVAITMTERVDRNYGKFVHQRSHILPVRPDPIRQW